MTVDKVKLDEEQRRIALASKDASILIKAGAGTGKTTILAERIVHLIGEGVSPDSILAIVFTDHEEKLIKQNIRNRLKNPDKVPSKIGTFWSIFSKIVRENIDKVDNFRNSEFSIIDWEGQKKKMRSIARSFETGALLDSECYDVRRLFMDIRLNGGTNTSTMHLTNEQIFEMCQQWQSFLHEKNLLDMDEVLVLCHKLLSTNQDIRDEMIRMCQYIMIDEIQDLNIHKWRVIQTLIKEGHTVFFGSGDPNACVFMHDGSLPDIYSRVEKELPNVQMHTLKRNWRSNKSIVKLANDLRQDKYDEVVAVHEGGGEVEMYNSEKLGIDQIVKSEEYSKWVILYRFDKWLPRIQQTLEDRGIPYNTQSDHDKRQYQQENSVSLVDMHHAKGLEWENVIIWKYRTLRELLINPEDKNLAYVAVSRAMERLLLFRYREKRITQLSKRKYL